MACAMGWRKGAPKGAGEILGEPDLDHGIQSRRRAAKQAQDSVRFPMAPQATGCFRMFVGWSCYFSSITARS